MSIAKELLERELRETKDTLAWLNKRLKEKRKEVATSEGTVAIIGERVAEIERELKEKK